MERPSQEPPVILEIAAEPKTRHDQERLRAAVAGLAAGNPAISYTEDQESGQFIIGSSDALLLRPVIRKLKQEDAIAFKVGSPQVAYRETITDAVTQHYLHARHDSSARQNAGVTLKFEPLPRHLGYRFENMLPEAALVEYLPGIERGLRAVTQTGVVAGFPMIGYKATLIAVEIHPADSSLLAFDIVTRACYREAMPKTRPILLEPIMKVSITVAAAAEADIVAFLEGRRGHVDATEPDGIHSTMQASVPLANLMDYVAGKGRKDWPDFSISMNFDRYAPVPCEPDNDGQFRGAMALREGARLA